MKFSFRRFLQSVNTTVTMILHPIGDLKCDFTNKSCKLHRNFCLQLNNLYFLEQRLEVDSKHINIDRLKFSYRK